MNRRGFLLGIASALLAPGLAAGAKRAPAKVHDLPLPRGSRSLEPDLFQSSQGFRKTVDFYKRFLKRQGLLHEEKPIYRYRNVTVARFISQERASRWQAIHVFQSDGRTRIAIVPRSPLTSPTRDGNETDSRT